MPKLFVANCTNQILDFHYRLPEHNKVLKIDIPIGEQREVPGVNTPHDIEAVLEQHTRYGMVNADEVDRVRRFSGYCYSLDKPVRSNKILAVHEVNRGALTQMGIQLRREAAIAAEAKVVEHEKGLKRLEMEITEEESPDRDAEVAETIVVDRKASKEETATGRPVGRRK